MIRARLDKVSLLIFNVALIGEAGEGKDLFEIFTV